ncbi:arylesterase [Woeseiaceae bacterium]|nr:arylesterase [Woeseiaceae bacterium]
MISARSYIRSSLLLLGILLTFQMSLAASPTIMVLGDSLSSAYGIPTNRGWVALLRQRLDELGYSHEVINASISGETTRGAGERLDELVAMHQPQLLIVELGGNDGLRGMSLKEMRENLNDIVDRSIGAGCRVLLVTMRLPPNYGSVYTDQFESIYGEVAQSTGAALAPFFLESIAGRPHLMQADGIHPRAQAQQQMLDNIWPVLAKLLENPGRSDYH